MVSVIVLNVAAPSNEMIVKFKFETSSFGTDFALVLCLVNFHLFFKENKWLKDLGDRHLVNSMFS
jgi:hypothetical protein